jgi:hypothetical protein
LLRVMAALVALCLPLIANAVDVSADTVAAGKKATALVVLDKEAGFGSAFCIDPTGLFVTNRHVVEGNSTVTLVLSPGEKGQQILKARVIREDDKNDLALIKVDPPRPLASLELGNPGSLFEAMGIVAFGYPFGAALALQEGQYPNITVSTGHVTSLRKEGGRLKLIQVDASLNPGNSGGPIVNATGQVWGIVVSGIPGTGINLAIPVSDLQALLKRPTITLSPVDLSLLRQREEVEFVIQVLAFRSLGSTDPDTDVEMTLSAGPGDSRTYPAARFDDKTFRIKAVPLPGSGMAQLLLRVKTDGTEVVYRAPDQTVLIDGRLVRLHLVQRIERGGALTFTSGQTVRGGVRGLDAIEVLNGTGKKIVNLSRAESISIEEVDPFASSAEYRVAVRQGGKIVGELTGVFGHQASARAAEPAVGRDEASPAPWQMVTAGREATARWSGRSVELTLPANASGSPIFLAGFQSSAALTGDFDIQVDYRLVEWPGGNGMRVGMRLAPLGGGEIGSVLHANDGSESDHFTIFPRNGGAQDVYTRPSPGLTGKLRMVRRNGTVMGLSWDAATSKWQILGSGGSAEDVRVVLMAWSDDNRFIRQQGKMILSNFTVNAGRWVARWGKTCTVGVAVSTIYGCISDTEKRIT